MAFRPCFFYFFDTPEVTKIVLPKVIQNFILSLLDLGTEPKKFFFLFFRVSYNAGRDYRVPPLSFFSTLCDFFQKILSAVVENTLTHSSPFPIFEP